MFISREAYNKMENSLEMGELSRKKLSKENKRLLEQLEDERAKHNRDAEKLVAKHDLELERLQRKLDKANDELQIHKELEVDQDQITTSKMNLLSRERILKAREEDFDNFTKEIAKAHKHAEDTREEGFKKGYADGLADGLREASKITAEDRKMAMQVALVSAASHQPGAAEEMVKDITTRTLGDGIGATDKPASKSKR